MIMIYILGFESLPPIGQQKCNHLKLHHNFTSNVYVYSVSQCITTDLAIFQIVQSQYGQASS